MAKPTMGILILEYKLGCQGCLAPAEHIWHPRTSEVLGTNWHLPALFYSGTHFFKFLKAKVHFFWVEWKNLQFEFNVGSTRTHH